MKGTWEPILVDLVLSLVMALLIIVLTGCTNQGKERNSTGAESWIREWGSIENDIGNDVAMDSSGIYVTGVTLGELENNKSAGEWDIFLVKYSFDGTQLWSRQIGTPGRDSGNSICTDNSGNVYVTGSVKGKLDGNVTYGGYDVFVIKFTSKGKGLWSRQWGTQKDDEGKGIALDITGIYVTGYTKGELDGNGAYGKSDAFLTKLNFDGKNLWTKQFGTEKPEWGLDVATDNTGAYIAGFTEGSFGKIQNAGGDDIFLTKFTTDGTKQWLKQWGTFGNDEGNSIVCSSSDIYVTGRTNGKLDGNQRIGVDDVFLSKFDTAGNKLWTRQIGTFLKDNAHGVGVNNSGVYVTGFTYGKFKGSKNYGASDMFIASYDLSGNKKEIEQFGTGGFDFGGSLVLTNSSIYVTGDSSFALNGEKNPNDNRNAFLVKWDF